MMIVIIMTLVFLPINNICSTYTHCINHIYVTNNLMCTHVFDVTFCLSIFISHMPCMCLSSFLFIFYHLSLSAVRIVCFVFRFFIVEICIVVG